MTYHLRMFLNWANDVRISNQEVSTRGQTPEGQYVGPLGGTTSKQTERDGHKLNREEINKSNQNQIDREVSASEKDAV